MAESEYNILQYKGILDVTNKIKKISLETYPLYTFEMDPPMKCKILHLIGPL